MQDHAAAPATIDRAIRDIEATRLHWPLAGALRGRADILAAGDPASAERDYTKADSIARPARRRPGTSRGAGPAHLYTRHGYIVRAMIVNTPALRVWSPETKAP